MATLPSGFYKEKDAVKVKVLSFHKDGQKTKNGEQNRIYLSLRLQMYLPFLKGFYKTSKTVTRLVQN